MCFLNKNLIFVGGCGSNIYQSTATFYSPPRFSTYTSTIVMRVGVVCVCSWTIHDPFVYVQLIQLLYTFLRIRSYIYVLYIRSMYALYILYIYFIYTFYIYVSHIYISVYLRCGPLYLLLLSYPLYLPLLITLLKLHSIPTYSTLLLNLLYLRIIYLS